MLEWTGFQIVGAVLAIGGVAAIVRHAFRLRKLQTFRQAQAAGATDEEIVEAFWARGEPPTHCRYCHTKLSHASTNAQLVRNLQQNSVLRPEVASVFMKVDRGLFLDQIDERDLPFPGRGLYLDCAYAIGDNAQISAPHIHAMTLGLLAEAVNRRRDHKLKENGVGGRALSALDIGSGTGFMTACLSVLLGDEGTVLGIEHMPDLVKTSQKNCDRIASCRAKRQARHFRIVVGDGRDFNCAELGGRKFDLVHCGAAVTEIPDAMMSLLKPGGRLVVPVGSVHANDQVRLPGCVSKMLVIWGVSC